MARTDTIPAQAGEDLPAGKARFTLVELLRYFLHLGTFGFGGPIATVGYMQRDLVERRRWIDERDLLDGIALGQTMPGPLAAQVVMWVGFLRARAIGALAAAAAFILPSFVIVLTVAFFYVRYEGLAWVQALFYGIAPGAVSIIALSAFRLARTTNKSELKLWLISAVLFVVTVVTETEIAFLFIGAGLLMVLLEAPPRILHTRAGGFVLAGSLPSVLVGSATFGTNVSLVLFFLKAGAFIFGSGLAIVPFLHSGVVEEHGWLTEGQFVDAVAMGLITPGPVVITATFIGYLVGGLVGALIATVAIFVPIYLGVVLPGPWFVRHRDNAQLKAFVRGATAAAGGAIAGVTVILAQQAINDASTIAIAMVAFLLLLRFKIKEPVIVGLAGVAGLLLY
ncbi:MAG: chromate efflux transporter [Chloroflexi bacterium]|nr:chromate efflux transporter [Chloroflexota bacterium]